MACVRRQTSAPASSSIVDDRGDPEGDDAHLLAEHPRRRANARARSSASTIIWRGPLREDDRDSQVSEVEGFVSRGVSGIVLAPLDEAALVQPVTEAVQQEDPGRDLRLRA